jgi:hypothetical protein
VKKLLFILLLGSAAYGQGGKIVFQSYVDAADAAKATHTTIAALRSAATPQTTGVYILTDAGQEGGIFKYDASDVSSADNGATVIINGTKRYKRIFEGPVCTAWFGSDATGVADSYAAFNNARIAAKALKRKVRIPSGAFKISQTIVIDDNYVVFEGAGSGRNASGSGTEIRFYGTGPLFDIGTYDGLAENSNLYNGKQGFTLRDVHCVASSGSTAVINEQSVSTYFTNTTFIRDNRGGNVSLQNVWEERFEYGFYGYESDFNNFQNVLFQYNKIGMYLGPRSDQGSYYGANFLLCQKALQITGAMGVAFYTPTFVDCGATAQPYVLISSLAETRNTGAISFHNPWFELGSTGGTGSVRASVLEIGTSESSTGHTSVVLIDMPSLLTDRVGNPGVMATINYFIKSDIADEIIINNPSGYGWANLTNAYVNAVGTGSPLVEMRGVHKYLGYVSIVNSGSGHPNVAMRKYSDATSSIGITEQFSGVSAASGIAKGIYYTPVLDATANADALLGVVFQPTFQDHGFTSVTHFSANFKASTLTEGNAQVSGRIDQYGSGLIIERASSPILRPWLDNSIYFTNNAQTNGLRLYNTGQLEASDAIQSTAVDACSQFKVTSTTKGLMLPRMTKTQRNAITTPLAGLMIYQTDNTPGLRVYNGTNWIKYTETTD